MATIKEKIQSIISEKNSKLIPSNLKRDVTLFGVTGNQADTSDATATASDIKNNATAYINNAKVVGNMPDNGSLLYSSSKTSQTIPEGYTSGGSISAVTSAIDENIIPDNIKKNVTILDVTGTLEQNSIQGTKTRLPLFNGSVQNNSFVEHLKEFSVLDLPVSASPSKTSKHAQVTVGKDIMAYFWNDTENKNGCMTCRSN